MFKFILILGLGVAIGYGYGWKDAQLHEKNIAERLVDRIGGAPRLARSASVMPVSLWSGMEWVVTART